METQPFDLWLERFEEMLMVERNASTNTLESYRRDLRKLGAYVAEKKVDVATLGLENLREFVADLFDQKLSPRSLARLISACRNFFQFLVIEGVRSDNPANKLDLPKHVNGLPKVLSEEQITSLITAAYEDTSPEGIRMTALMEILYATGMRVS